MSLVRHPSDGRVHFSELKAMAKSPRHFKLACSEAKKPTRAMTVGAIGDCLVFGQRAYAVYPGKVRNGKEWDAWQAANPGLIHCIASELEDAKGSSYAVLDDPVAQSIRRPMRSRRRSAPSGRRTASRARPVLLESAAATTAPAWRRH